MANYPHKPTAPSVREVLSPSIDRFTKTRQREVVLDILSKIHLPATIETEWRERYGITDDTAQRKTR